MSISSKQALQLLADVSKAVPDELHCDGCFELFAELADAERQGRTLSDSLMLVRNHLSQCKCCAYEYESLLEAIHAAEE